MLVCVFVVSVRTCATVPEIWQRRVVQVGISQVTVCGSSCVRSQCVFQLPLIDKVCYMTFRVSKESLELIKLKLALYVYHVYVFRHV